VGHEARKKIGRLTYRDIVESDKIVENDLIVIQKATVIKYTGAGNTDTTINVIWRYNTNAASIKHANTITTFFGDLKIN
jgi:hypothetical protein